MIKIRSLENIFLTSDSHLGHSNILKFTGRPYNSVDEMDLDLIDKWNSVTDNESIIYHLGDFTLGSANLADQYFSQLNGLAICVLGLDWHHDKRWLKHAELMRTKTGGHIKILPPIEVLDLLPLQNENGYTRKITMSHYPLWSWEGSFHGQFHVHGHIHSDSNSASLQKGCEDVGVDKWNGELLPLKFLVDRFLSGSEIFGKTVV